MSTKCPCPKEEILLLPFHRCQVHQGFCAALAVLVLHLALRLSSTRSQPQPCLAALPYLGRNKIPTCIVPWRVLAPRLSYTIKLPRRNPGLPHHLFRSKRPG